jgi:hypothetical protein
MIWALGTTMVSMEHYPPSMTCVVVSNMEIVDETVIVIHELQAYI